MNHRNDPPESEAAAEPSAGTYFKIAEGARAFVPAPLSSNPPVDLSSQSVLQNLISAERAVARLDGRSQELPDLGRLIAQFVRKEALLSSEIEGTKTTFRELVLFQKDQADGDHDTQEVDNYVRALQHGIDRLDSLPISTRLLREMHEILLSGVRGQKSDPGNFREIQNQIGGDQRDPSTAIYLPPPPQKVPDLLSNLEKYLHRESPVSELVQIGIAHAQFEMIHPFLDGNGRVGRILIPLFLISRGVISHPNLPISLHLLRQRREYFDRLLAISETGDWRGWLTFFLEIIERSCQTALDLAERVFKLKSEHEELVYESFGPQGQGPARRLLEHLYQEPVVSISDVEEVCDISYEAARRKVHRFEELDLLEEATGKQRNRRYLYEPYVQLFSGERDFEFEGEPLNTTPSGPETT